MQNLSQQIQTLLSQKPKTFWISDRISEIAWNLDPFQKKDEYPSLIISEIIDA